MGRTSWEGWQAESWTPRTIDPERAPAEIQPLWVEQAGSVEVGALIRIGPEPTPLGHTRNSGS